MKIIIGSRGSKLALVQSEIVKDAIEALDESLEVEIKVINTKGDKILDKPLQAIGDKGLFTREIEEELFSGEIDLAVHSMKDMPTSLVYGLMFAGTLQANDAHDCLVFNHGYTSLKDLPLGATIGTGSPRRKYQLLKYRPDLNIVGIRGNVQTRLKKMEEQHMDAIVLAMAGLNRLEYSGLTIEPLDYSVMVPAPAQGILAIEVKEGSMLLPILKKIEDHKATMRMHLERQFLQATGGGCHSPIGCHVEFVGDKMVVDACYGDDAGKVVCQKHVEFKDEFEKNIIHLAKAMKSEVVKSETLRSETVKSETVKSEVVKSEVE